MTSRMSFAGTELLGWWLAHTVITEYLDHADSVLLRLNLDVRTLTKRLTPTLGVYVVMILVGLFLPVLAVLGYLLIALFMLVPFSAFRHGADARI